MQIAEVHLHRHAKEVRSQMRLKHGSKVSLEHRGDFIHARFDDGYLVAIPMTSVGFIVLGEETISEAAPKLKRGRKAKQNVVEAH